MKKADSEKVRKFLDESKKRFQYTSDAEAEARNEMLDDKRCYHIGCWTPDEINERGGQENCLNIPRSDQFIRKIQNDRRQNKPQFKITPRDAISKEIQDKLIKAAELNAGLVKNIVYESQGQNAIQHAYDEATIMGRGFYRVQ